jgi:hypothetical protein
MQKGIELPKETIEALLNGASMFIVPIDDERIKGLHCHGFSLGTLWFSNDKNNKPLELANGFKHGVPILPPRQIGDEFYAQEPYTCGKKGENLHYEFDFANANVFDDWCDYCCTTNFEPCMMTHKQSRVKGKIVNAEVKKVQDIEVYKLPTKDKKYFEEFTYHCTTEPIEQKRIRGFIEYLKKIGIDYKENPFVLYTQWS